MKFCQSCGMQLDDGVRFCANCGAPVSADAQQAQQTYQQPPYQQPFQQPAEPDVPSTGLKVLSFFIPLAGLILFLLNQKDKPISAKAYGKMALIAFILSIVFYIIYFVALGAFIASGTFAMDTYGYSYYMFASLL